MGLGGGGDGAGAAPARVAGRRGGARGNRGLLPGPWGWAEQAQGGRSWAGSVPAHARPPIPVGDSLGRSHVLFQVLSSPLGVKSERDERVGLPVAVG
jgi:hypothetical protein